MKYFFIYPVLIVIFIGCGASDYNDSIGLGYSIHRFNSFEKVIGPDNGALLYSTSSNLGPLNRYTISNNLIIAEHFGAIKEFETDKSSKKYIIIDTEKNTYKGPLSVLPSSYDNLNWKSPLW